jgi:hypothetical protein
MNKIPVNHNLKYGRPVPRGGFQNSNTGMSSSNYIINGMKNVLVHSIDGYFNLLFMFYNIRL